MIIDVVAQCMPPRLLQRAVATTGPAGRKALTGVTGLDDLRRTVDWFARRGYRQVPTITMRVIEEVTGAHRLGELCQAGNEELREVVAREPARFPTAFGVLPLADPIAAFQEVDHLAELGLPGFQCSSDVLGRPLDEAATVEVLAYALSRGLVCSLQPRSAGWSRHDTRASPWRALEGAYETSSAMLRLGFSDLFVRQPAGVIIAHQMGGMIPLIALMVDDEEGRDPTRPSPPVGLDRLLRFHVDTATSGGPHVIRAGVDFFGAEHVLFAGGLPYSLRDRHSLIRRAIEAVEESGLSEDEVSAIFEGNARRLLRL